uniref:RluA family pseudouridine synthase n=1 Tax=Agathobacter sp. TaxID=2021311 RepID=UPI0040291793
MTQPEIIYEDEDILVCHKPAGVATQTKRLGQKDMESILKNYIAVNNRKAGRMQPPYIGIVHRLDQPVEGVMVYAKTPQAAAKLSAQVKKRFVGKHYYALVQLPEGKQSMEEIGLDQKGTLENEIAFDAKRNVSAVMPQKTKETKHACLDYEVVAQKGKKLLLDITLHTGRHHQIRVQLAHAGIPIVGDTKYGKYPANQLGLCSYRISFGHPSSGTEMDYTIMPKNEEICTLLKAGKRV